MKQLLEWFALVKRDLPWRRTRDPYAIWVSEIMLQQTRVDTVIPYYERFMSRFPNVHKLAEAPEDDVLKMWEGLGYYSRARHLQAGARQVVELYEGVIPADVDKVAALRGVGPYTKGAIMSIAFNAPIPAVDGNVMRVTSRYFGLDADIAKPSARVDIERMITAHIPEGHAGDFNQALMELGALICTPRGWRCEQCPLSGECVAFRERRVEHLPVKTKAKAPRREQRVAYIVRNESGQVYVRQRASQGLLANLWELPHELRNEEEPIGNYYKAVEHVFSHIVWELNVYETTREQYTSQVQNGKWIGPEQLQQLAFATVFGNLLRDLWKEDT